MNHCVIINKVSLCSMPSMRCEFFKKESDIEGCIYYLYGRCCHSTAICNAVEKEKLDKDK